MSTGENAAVQAAEKIREARALMAETMTDAQFSAWLRMVARDIERMRTN